MNGTRFFILGTEHDWSNEDQNMTLAIQAAINAGSARKQKRKSVENCIGRAKRGVPSGGKKPYGRVFDRGTETWAVDEAKRAVVEDVANRYLAGESMAKLAEELGVNHSTLHKRLMEKCGDRYTITFDVADLSIHESIEIKIPRLLPEKTIKALRKKAEANKTYRHGQPKNPYLFSGMVFCNRCGYSMFGQKNHRGDLYYRHAHAKRAKQCPLKTRPYPRADDLEDVVVRVLFETLGNPAAVERAIERATPNTERIKKAQARLTDIGNEQAKVAAAREKILRLITRDALTEDQAEKQLAELKDKDAKLSEEMERLRESLEHVPSAATIKAAATQAVVQFKGKFLRYSDARVVAEMQDADTRFDSEENPRHGTMTWEDKRALALQVFDGYAPDGRPAGIYVEALDGQQDHRHKRYRFTLYGHVINGTKCVTHSASHCRAQGPL